VSTDANQYGNYRWTGGAITIDGIKITATSSVNWNRIAMNFQGDYATVKNTEVYGLPAYVAGSDSVVFDVLANYSSFQSVYLHDIADWDMWNMWGHDNHISFSKISNCSNPDYSATGPHADLIQTWGGGSYNNYFECSVFENNTISGGMLNCGGGGSPCDPTARDFDYRNDIFANSGTQAIQDHLTNFHLYNNVFYNYPGGFAIWGSPYGDDAQIYNNVFMGYGMSGYTSTTTRDYNAWDQQAFDNTNYNQYQWGPNNFIITDPGFVDAANGDFHLQANSPLRGKGLNLSGDAYMTMTDCAGNPRPASGGWDIGPYQYTGP
jgi:hypothetical protein